MCVCASFGVCAWGVGAAHFLTDFRSPMQNLQHLTTNIAYNHWLLLWGLDGLFNLELSLCIPEFESHPANSDSFFSVCSDM